jgi:hypothetical protein
VRDGCEVAADSELMEMLMKMKRHDEKEQPLSKETNN